MKGRSHQAHGESPIASTFARTPLHFPVWCWDAEHGLAHRRGLSGRLPTVQVAVNAHPAPAPYWVLSPGAEFTKPRKVALVLSKARNCFMEELSRPSWWFRWFTALIKTLRSPSAFRKRGAGARLAVTWPEGRVCADLRGAQDAAAVGSAGDRPPGPSLSCTARRPRTRRQEAARGTVETPAGEVAHEECAAPLLLGTANRGRPGDGVYDS